MTLIEKLIRGDREHAKFCNDSNGEVAVRTCSEITGGNLTVVPPANFKVTTSDITDTATLVPAAIDPNTVSYSIQNKSTTETLYIGPTSGVLASNALGSLAGWEVGPQETMNFSLDNAGSVYCIAPTGKTIRIKVLEWIGAP